MVKLEKHIKEEKYMLTEEQKKEIEDLYNYYWELYLEKKEEEDADKKLYLGKLSGMDEVLSCLGYKTKMKYGLVLKEEE